MKILAAVALVSSILIFSFYNREIKHSAKTQVLKIPLIAQVGHFWCWAACLEMVMNYHSSGYPYQQCNVAINRINSRKSKTEKKLDCVSCLSECPILPACDEPIGNIDNIKEVLRSYNYSAVDTNFLNWETIKKEIEFKKPIIAILRNPCSEYRDTCKPSHAVVIIGVSEIQYQANSFKREIIVNDPKSDSFCKGQTRNIIFDNDIETIICSYIWDIHTLDNSKSIY